MTGPDQANGEMLGSACCAASRTGAEPISAEGSGAAVSSGAIPDDVSTAVSADPGADDGMILLPGGTFAMGTDDRGGYAADGEGPIRKIRVSPFWIDRTAVSNGQFAAFVEATGYVTEAETFGWAF